MKSQTKILFVVIVGLAMLAVGGFIYAQISGVASFSQPVQIKVAAPPSLFDWVTAMAADYEATHANATIDVVAMKGLNAPTTLDFSQGERLPDAWIAEADFVRQMARNVPYQSSGPSVAADYLIWVTLQRYPALLGQVSWDKVHTAATDVEQWQTWSDGDFRFDIALSSPENSVEGLATFASAAAAYYNDPNLSPAKVAPNSDFADWFAPIAAAAPNLARGNSATAQLTTTPVSVDVGMIRAAQWPALDATIVGQNEPEYQVELNFPYLLRQGDDAPDAAAKQALAADFGDFLRKPTAQDRLVGYGFSSQSSGIPVVLDGNTAGSLQIQFK